MNSRFTSPRTLAAVLLPALAVACPAQETADLVVINGDVLTIDPEFRRVSAVAIRDGLFVAVGSDVEIRRWMGETTRRIDAGGRTVIPGLIETHVHPAGAARGEVQQTFEQLHSIDEIKA